MERTVDYSKIERQHEAMKKDMRRLRAVATNRPEGLSADGLRELLGNEIARLHECLRKHFRLEEQGGYLDAVIAAHRGHAPTVSRLLQQHSEILAELEDAARACRCRVSLQKTTTSVLRILDVLGEHEAEEHRVMQEAVLDDLGTGD